MLVKTPKIIPALLISTALSATLSACSTSTDHQASQLRQRPTCELPGHARKPGKTTLLAPRQRVVASRSECEMRGGNTLIAAAD